MAKKGAVADEAEDEDVTYYVFVKERRCHFGPQHITAGIVTIKHIFPVPEANAVGTLDDQNNGIALVEFGEFGEDPKCKVTARNYGDKIFDAFTYRFSPNFSDDKIAYSQNRVAVIADIKTEEAFYVRCGLSMDDFLTGIRFLDPQDNLLAVVKSIAAGSGWKNYLHVLKLEGPQVVADAEIMELGKTRNISPDFPPHNNWLVLGKKIFAYSRERHRISCYDGNTEVRHSFSDLYNANARSICEVKDFIIHPTLPFGIIIEKRWTDANNLLVLRTNITNPKKQGDSVISLDAELLSLKRLFDLEKMGLAYQSFSPDGDWYVAGFISPAAPKAPHFIAVPVVCADYKKHYDFLDMDNLVVLGQVNNLTSFAWTHEPTSFVVSDGELLYKWDFDELPDARVFVVPEDGDGKKGIFKKLSGLLKRKSNG